MNKIDLDKEKSLQRKNEELQKLLDEKTADLIQKNRDLEIEASLERVRAVALSMKKPDDLLSICKVLYEELLALGFSELRNAMINIHDDDAGSFLNYDYSSAAGPTVTTIFYNSHPATESLVKQIRKENDAFAEFAIEGNELDKWREYRKNMGEKDDPKLDNVSALYYYFYSIGIGGIGISNYGSITDEKLNLLKRFRNVFYLAYRRYMDVAQAEAQAREAKIEASLERVRARSMAMHKSDELVEASTVLFNELKSLGIETVRTGVGIIDSVTETVEIWSSQLIEGKRNKILGVVPKNVHPFFEGYYEAWKGKQLYFFYEIAGDEVREYYKRMSSILSYPEKIEFNQRESFYTFFFPEGSLNVVSQNNLSKDECNLMIRFARVFGLIYRRFLDLQKAETQAREAQIEASLERVRSKTMAMHNSREVGETVAVMFDELRKLGIETYRCGIGIMDEANKMEVWAAKSDKNGKVELIIGYLDMSLHPLLKGAFDNWKNKKGSYYYHLRGKDLIKYFNAINKHEYYPVTYDLNSLPVEIFHNDFYFNEGTLFVFTLKQLSTENESTFKRFAGVFGQTYRRYLDLLRAEAQAREAQIEAALEKVRGKAMAMHNSDDLTDAAGMVFTELNNLGIKPIRSGFVLLTKDSRTAKLYPATSFDNKNTLSFTGEFEFTGHTIYEKQYQSWQKKENYFPVLEGDMLKSYYKILAKGLSIPYENFPTNRRQFGTFLPFTEGFLFAWSDEPYTEKEINILDRFKVILDLTIRRYLDLKNAEAQSRESQIEASLERVRSKAMAMQKSEDLGMPVATIFEELDKLKLEMLRCGIGIINKHRRSVHFWSTSISEQGSILQISGDESMNTHTLLQGAFEAWLTQGDFSYVLEGEDLKNYYKSLPESQSILSPSESAKQYYYVVTFQAGGLFAFRESDFPGEAKTVLKRFADVINFTYTRFNDLKLAEAQTHKAQIETAMERARARALAMQEPEELVEVIKVLRHEMGLLGVEELETSTVLVYDETTGNAKCWFASKDDKHPEKGLAADHVILELNATKFGRDVLSFFNSKKDPDRISIEVNGTNRKEWLGYLYKLSSAFDGFFGDEIPDRTFHFYKNSNKAIGVSTPGEISEEGRELIERATSVFSLAYSRYKDLTQSKKDLQLLKDEKKRSDSLLLNILPEEIAAELKQFGKSYARKHEEVTILFADIKGFTEITESLSANELVTQLDECFRAFDYIIEKHGLEKIKTIGDAYVCACGLPKPVEDNASKTVKAALDMMDFIRGFSMTKKIQDLPAFEFRIGINTGPAITGVVGLKKFTYDIWGEAVNMAARMEQHGEAGKINISESTYMLVKDKFKCTNRGSIEAKNKGKVEMYFVEGS